MMADLKCIAWGPLLGPTDVHPDCPVIVTSHPLPMMCPCECQTCKRSWFAQGRPIVKDGKVIRMTAERQA